MKKLIVLLLVNSFFTIANLFAQQTISGSFISNGQTRHYLGAVPDNPEPPLRLVILFGGVNEDAAQMVLRGFNDHLGTNTAVVYPEPFIRQGIFTSGFDNPMDTVTDDYQMVEDLIGHMDAIYDVAVDDICVGGFSNGGMFAYDLVCDFNANNATRKYRFKAFAIVSAAMDSSEVLFGNCPIVNELPMIAFYGTFDSTYYGGVPSYPNGYPSVHMDTVVKFWATTINGCDDSPTVTALPDLVEERWPSTVELIEYDCHICNNTKLYRIVNGGLSWPSGNGWIDNGAVSANLDVDASKLIAEFFECSVSDSINTSALEVEAGNKRVSVFPNPVTDVLSINTTLNINQVEILNAMGKTVFAEKQPNPSISIDDLPSGVYFLRIATDEGISFARIIKE